MAHRRMSHAAGVSGDSVSAQKFHPLRDARIVGYRNPTFRARNDLYWVEAEDRIVAVRRACSSRNPGCV